MNLFCNLLVGKVENDEKCYDLLYYFLPTALDYKEFVDLDENLSKLEKKNWMKKEIAIMLLTALLVSRKWRLLKF